MARSRGARIVMRIVTLLAVLWIPVIDPPISYLLYRAYVAEYAGPKIYRTIENVDRVRLAGGMIPESVSIRYNREEFSTDGKDRNEMAYDVVDYNLGGHDYEETFESGRSGRKEIKYSSARYVVERTRYSPVASVTIDKVTISTVEGEVLGECSWVLWHGGWIMRMPIETNAKPFYAGTPYLKEAKFVHEVLNPRIAK